MGETLVWLSQLSMWLGFMLAMGAQIVAFFSIAKRNALHAALALILPGYLAYLVWNSEYRMPRILKAWFTGFVMFVVGAVVIGLAMEL